MTSPTAEQPVIHSDAERVMDAITAYQVTSMLQGAVAAAPAPRASGNST